MTFKNPCSNENNTPANIPNSIPIQGLPLIKEPNTPKNAPAIIIPSQPIAIIPDLTENAAPVDAKIIGTDIRMVDTITTYKILLMFPINLPPVL